MRDLIHPHLTHPLTGRPLAALGYRADGRPIWPIVGAADGDDKGGAGDTGAAGDGKAGEPGKSGEADKAGESGKTGDSAGGKTSDKGFPEGTPVAEMTPDQQVAYWKDKAQKHESRNQSLLRITGGKHGDDLKAALDELEQLRTANMSAAEKAVEDAKKQAQAEAQQAFGPKLARIAFEAAFAHIEDDGERNELIDALNLTSVITDDGEIDTAKVRAIANKIAPTAKGAGTQRHDYGAGRRNGQQGSGVKAGEDLFAATRKKPTTTSS